MPKDFQLFIAVWITLGIGGSSFFFLSRNARLKRSLFLPFMIVVSALFLGFTWFSNESTPRRLPIVVIMVALGIFITIRTTRFCDDCGRTTRSLTPFSSPKFCSKCGAKLE